MHGSGRSGNETKEQTAREVWPSSYQLLVRLIVTRVDLASLQKARKAAPALDFQVPNNGHNLPLHREHNSFAGDPARYRSPQPAPTGFLQSRRTHSDDGRLSSIGSNTLPVCQKIKSLFPDVTFQPFNLFDPFSPCGQPSDMANPVCIGLPHLAGMTNCVTTTLCILDGTAAGYRMN